jgi:hypothetical protein
MVSMVPAMVTVWVGSVLTCAQLGKTRAKTKPDALRIVVPRFMCFSPSGFTLWTVLGFILHIPLRGLWLRLFA